MKKNFDLTILGALIFGLFLAESKAWPYQQSAIVIVNSESPNYSGFSLFIQPYLKNFGIPYAVLDITSERISQNIGEYAVIIIGHNYLDPGHAYLDQAQESYILAAIQNGTGLVNFDNYLSLDSNLPLYQFIDHIFGFAYSQPAIESGITFTSSPGGLGSFITANHQIGENVDTGVMNLAGIIAPHNVSVLAVCGSSPFLAVATSGFGRAVQWGSYDWMSISTKGPIAGLDDLVWRSIVWAARKPFPMQGLLNFVTMRVDDCSGPFWWINTCNEFGLKPWLGLFINEINDEETATLSAITNAGKATASIHAFSSSDFFFYDHFSGGNFPNDLINSYYNMGTQWHLSRDIPISKFVVPHYYEFGTNALTGLKNWGIEFIGTVIDIGQPYYGSPWTAGRPYRLNEPFWPASLSLPFSYADFIVVPGHQEFDRQFFNCLTEIRDVSGYEWFPNNDVSGSIDRGTRQIKRAFDSMVLGTLFTHEYLIQDIYPDNWRAIIQGIVNSLASYNPIFITMDEACKYLRAIVNTDITEASYDPILQTLTVTLAGQSDMKTKIHVFSGEGESIIAKMMEIPSFSGTIAVNFYASSSLDRIVITPDLARLSPGGFQQFLATGYDANGNAIPNLTFTWAASSGGTIDQNGLFQAGYSAGVYTDSISASREGITGYASVEVYEPVLDHFNFDLIIGPVVAGVPFGVRITAYDQFGQVFRGYTGEAALSDTTGTIVPAVTGNFTAGVWSGNVAIGQAASGVRITVTSGTATGVSNAFDVQASVSEIIINCWEDAHQSPVLVTTTNPGELSTTDGRWTEFHWVSGRSFPAVFAGADEESYGLPVMRFYATGIPNGRYEVIANLYTQATGRNMRYYYGYTPENPKAYFVDTVGGAGGSDQHEEYSLGTVVITDGSFNIYVQDADLLSGSYPYFGWAWIRLVAAN